MGKTNLWTVVWKTTQMWIIWICKQSLDHWRYNSTAGAGAAGRSRRAAGSWRVGSRVSAAERRGWSNSKNSLVIYTHRIHGAGIYLPTKLGDFVRANVDQYSSTMDPMGIYIYIILLPLITVSWAVSANGCLWWFTNHVWLLDIFDYEGCLVFNLLGDVNYLHPSLAGFPG
jgi:hypothetical protein